MEEKHYVNAEVKKETYINLKNTSVIIFQAHKFSHSIDFPLDKY